MNVLVVGKGGREHALARAMALSPSKPKVWALPGNPGMTPLIQILPDAKVESAAIVEQCQKNNIDMVVIGPEDPLVAGLADELRDQGISVFGPDKRGAQLEGSKIFAKQFMEKHKVPTAKFQIVESVEQVEAAFKDFTAPYVLKADGLAAGKGVFICKTSEELLQAANSIFNEKSLGDAGRIAILEQFQPGFELSFFVLTNGESYTALPMAQDHKRLLDNDEGPNTGGMGTVAPMHVDEQTYQQIIDQVVEPTVKGLSAEGFTYRGVVFIGLMMTGIGPQVLEYNIRFGDPETQVLMPLLDGDWANAFSAIAEGEVPNLSWRDSAAACVVLAAENYPVKPVKGVPIGGDLSDQGDSYLLHAGTATNGEGFVTSGGRVLNAIGEGGSITDALAKAYSRARSVSWPGMQYRKDIGSKV